MKQVRITIICLFIVGFLHAQNPVAIGQWKSYLPYAGTISVADGGDKVYAANSSSVFSFDKTDNSFRFYDKTNGLGDIGTTAVYYGTDQKTLVITYLNSNVDFIINDTIVNFPYIKTGNISGNKSINDVTFFENLALLSCSFGIVLFDVDKKESPDTYTFLSEGSYIKVNSATVYDYAIYAATDLGVFYGDMDENLSDFSKWVNITATDTTLTGVFSQLTTFDNAVYAIYEDTAIYKYQEDEWDIFQTIPSYFIRHMNIGPDALITLSYKGSSVDIADSLLIIRYDTDGTITPFSEEGGVNLFSPKEIDVDENKNMWVAEAYRGIVRFSSDYNTVNTYAPNGPPSAGAFDMEFYDHALWVAPGEVSGSWNGLANLEGFFLYNYGYWASINKFNYPQMDSANDIITLTINALNGKTYFGSFGGGLIEYDKSNGSLQVFQTNFPPECALQDATGDSLSCRVSGVQFDLNGNLWMSNFSAPNPLVVYTADGQWKNFDCELPPLEFNYLTQVAIDDYDQKWVALAKGNGILVYNHGASIMDASDDQKRQLGTGAGNGNLPVRYVNCIVKDKDGELWVGTAEGITIFYNPSEIFSGTTSGDASQPLVNLGGYNEYLLSKEIVNCIAVDGANRKWVGTNSGVFLISEDGTEQLLFFNQDNSPLFSNIVLSITIDGTTGEVFFGTSKGIVSYRSTATDGAIEHTNVLVYPNPVRENYNGPIAINGLVENAQVKITDAAGRLIYETVALGGQAIWDGKGYEGNRAKTGVYLVYSSNDDGSETYVAKFLIVN